MNKTKNAQESLQKEKRQENVMGVAYINFNRLSKRAQMEATDITQSMCANINTTITIKMRIPFIRIVALLVGNDYL